jgi:hypothetical protein
LLTLAVQTKGAFGESCVGNAESKNRPGVCLSYFLFDINLIELFLVNLEKWRLLELYAEFSMALMH